MRRQGNKEKLKKLIDYKVKGTMLFRGIMEECDEWENSCFVCLWRCDGFLIL